MPKAFARIPASELEAALDGNNIPTAFEEALRAAITACREIPSLGGESIIEVFVVDDSDDEDEEDEASAKAESDFEDEG